MKRYLFSVYDRVACVYAAPFLEVNRGAAVRAFSDAIAHPDNKMASHGDDFDLFLFGMFDDSSGAFELEERPECIALGKSVKRE